MVDNNDVSVDSGTPTSDPSSSDEGKSQQQKNAEAPLNNNIPENLRGKSPAELAEMYSNLEKKLGEQSDEVNKVREMKKDMDIVLQAIWSDPETYREVERRVAELQGGALPETRVGKKGSGEAEDKPETKEDSDVRKAEQARAISEFENKFGFNELPSDKRAEINKKIANELSELVDPNGNKSVAQVINEIPVNLLGGYLEKAYVLANKDILMSGGSSVQDLTSIGSMAASSGKSKSQYSLTEHESKVAEGLRVDPNKYANSKKKIRG